MTRGVDPRLQQQAKALGDPTRYEVFRYVVEAERPVGVAELTEHMGLNHNAIRQHLTKLVDAELLAERKEAHRGRGRPRLVYTVDPSVPSRWGVKGPYERLSVWLAEVISSGESPREVGRRIARGEQAGPGAVDAVAAITDDMRRQGFDPDTVHEGDSVEITLRSCPFESAAIASPSTVCELHAGMVEAVVDSMEGIEMEGFVAVDPAKAGCRLRLRVDATNGAAPAEDRPDAGGPDGQQPS